LATPPPPRRPENLEGSRASRRSRESTWGNSRGVWLTESLTAPSGEVAKEDLKGRTLVIEGNRFARKQDGKTFMAGRLALDTGGKQKALVTTATDREGAEVWALYEIDGDTLRNDGRMSETGLLSAQMLHSDVASQGLP
jgi:uncharacterized protein (TIGR03067 family)